MKKKFLFLAISILFFKLSYSQTSCGDATTQLQNYASQINRFYNNEYCCVIPNNRCPAFDRYGRPFNPRMVQDCRLHFLFDLNNWYAIQCNYINNWYANIVRGCSVRTPATIAKPAPPKRQGSQENEKIDTDKIDELTAGIDENKTVRITIPTTAEGFKPKQ